MNLKDRPLRFKFTKNSIIEYCKPHKRYCIKWRGGKHERALCKEFDDA